MAWICFFGLNLPENHLYICNSKNPKFVLFLELALTPKKRKSLFSKNLCSKKCLGQEIKFFQGHHWLEWPEFGLNCMNSHISIYGMMHIKIYVFRAKKFIFDVKFEFQALVFQVNPGSKKFKPKL